MEAVNHETKEVRSIVRIRTIGPEPVIWCPFCDRSQMGSSGPFCAGCHAEFREGVDDVAPPPMTVSEVEPIVEEVTDEDDKVYFSLDVKPTRRTRRRS